MFDLPNMYTLRLCSMLASFTFAVMFLTLRLGKRGTAAFEHWAASAAAYACVILGFELCRGEPGMYAGAFLYCLLAASDVLILTGVRAFEGQRPFARWMLAPLLAPGLLYALLAWLPGHGVAIEAELSGTFATLGLLGTKTAVSAALLRTRLSSAPRGRRIAGVALFSYVPVYAIAIAADFMGNRSLHLGAVLPMLADQVLLAMLNLGLLSMQGERSAVVLQDFALRDPLTGAWNRAWLDKHRADLSRAGAAAIIIDIDHFKTINDRHGHAAGDAVLAAFAQRAAQIVAERGGSLVRLGGDEFVAIVPDITPQAAEKLAQAVLAAPTGLGTTLPVFTVSLGVAMLRQDHPDVAEGIMRADGSLYLAKAGGRAQVAMAGEPRAIHPA